MIPSPFDAYVAKDTADLFGAHDNDDIIKAHLLWGDGVKFADGQIVGGRRKVRARGRNRVGWIDTAALTNGKPLLELYFIDVGQGDGVLIRTPDFRHILIDGGYPRAKQNTGKSAADFVDWKFFEDYALDRISLDVMIASHNDEDHYGGLADLLDPAQYVSAGGTELDAQGITVDRFFHAGLSWWKEGGKRTLGPIANSGTVRCYTRLLTDRASAVAATANGASPALQGMWRQFIERVIASRTTSAGPTPIDRLHPAIGHLPGFEPGNASGATIHVLGPIDFDVNNSPALPVLGTKESKSTNGNSVLLRLDFGKARIVLTGDLNLAAHRLILSHYQGHEDELACDVAKACHHGSDDISYRFLEAMTAAATIISSGDGEGHDHPRPVIVAASGLAGHKEIKDEQLVTPLVYCTEMARSVSLGTPTKLKAQHQGSAVTIVPPELQAARMTYSEQKPGDLRPRTRSREMGKCSIVAGLIYGLVNVRTDGRKILLATMNEGDGSWSVKKFKSRF